MTSALLCLAFAIYFEARGEPQVGQYAVAEVIVNRRDSDRFPDTVCGVVRQGEDYGMHRCQFSFMCDGKPEEIANPLAFDEAKLIANDVLNLPGTPDYVDGALFYHTHAVSPSWSQQMEVTAVYGDHIFFSDDVSLRDESLALGF
ncbi:cell wall hydrolase [Ruegeria phage RpAliso]|nr:cell wall hydrolase [Ruegeria phage RpAliso]